MVLAFLSAPAGSPVAAADGCPDAEVVFARGTGEPVGPGGPGQAFFDSLSAQLPDKSVNLYPVDYPSTTDYANSAKAGAADEVAHVQGTVANCPKTKVVIGGYSQGAGVADLTSHQLSPQIANHVAAVAWNFATATSGSSHALQSNLVVGASGAANNPLVVTLTNDALMAATSPAACANTYFSMPALTGVTATGGAATSTTSPATDAWIS